MRFRLPSRLKGSGVSPETVEKLRGKIDKEDLPRVPPGQFVTNGWPVLHYGGVPAFDPQTWDFKVWGLVERPLRLNYEEFRRPAHDGAGDGHPLRHPLEQARPALGGGAHEARPRPGAAEA